MRLEDHIRDIPDFPKPGITFKDITPLFLDPDALRFTVGALAGLVEQAGGVVAGCAFVIELAFLNGRERLSGYDVESLVVYDSE